MQDYFAHCVKTIGIRTEKDYYYSEKAKNPKQFLIRSNSRLYLMFEMNEEIGIAKNKFEDNTSVFSWRDELAKEATYFAYSCWCSNKKIKKLYVTGWGFNNYKLHYKKYYWSIWAIRYFLNYQ